LPRSDGIDESEEEGRSGRSVAIFKLLLIEGGKGFTCCSYLQASIIDQK
jgi:hypothetical protein